jgi:arylsulfatase A-like enzyme
MKRMEVNRRVIWLVAILLLIVSFSIFFNRTNLMSLLFSNESGESASYKCPGCNVILITMDAVRPDHLGCYGYERNTSPNIDKLASEGVLFKNAISRAPWTIDSIASIFTSLYHHNVRITKDKENNVITINGITDTTLAEVLKEKNYSTASFVTAGLLDPSVGFDKGFDTYVWNNLTDRSASTLTDAVMGWIGENYKKPFFLYLHYIDPHAPYESPAPYNTLFVNDSFYNESSGTIPKLLEDINGVGGIPSFALLDNRTDIAYYISQYDGEIAYVDKNIGLLIDKLESLNLTNKTLIIVTADHGESMGEHDMYFTHDILLYDTLLKVPLVMKYPNRMKPKIVDIQVRSIDIAPTIFDFLNIKINNTIDGVSLLPIIFEGANVSLEAYSRVAHYEPGASIRTNEWKFIYNTNSKIEELYDLKEDPGELNNIVDQKPEVAEKLKQKLLVWLAKGEIKFLGQTKEINPKEISEELKEKLKSLGYLV